MNLSRIILCQDDNLSVQFMLNTCTRDSEQIEHIIMSMA